MDDQAGKRYHRCQNCSPACGFPGGFCEWLGFPHCHVSCLIWCGLFRGWKLCMNRAQAVAAKLKKERAAA